MKFMKRVSFLFFILGSFLFALLLSSTSVQAATLPANFTHQKITDISAPVAMAVMPDGRILVATQGGQLRVVKNGQLLPTPALTLSVDNQGERGLLGVAVDPEFSANQFIYVYYTVPTVPVHNRVSRFVLDGDVVNPASETVLYELDDLNPTSFIHNGGALHFGTDGYLYIASGDGSFRSRVQQLNSTFGKLLRIKKDGTIPESNPFVASATGKYQAIYAMGFRNPFSFAINASNDIYLNDVGQDTWEEINKVELGKNYGWPTCEGAFRFLSSNPCNKVGQSTFADPLYAYHHSTGTVTGKSITGGAFYAGSQFPAEYAGRYFFGDYVNDWIKVYNPQDGSVSGFADTTYGVVDLQVGTDGTLYYLSYVEQNPGLYAIQYQDPNPQPTPSPTATPTPTFTATPTITITPPPSTPTPTLTPELTPTISLTQTPTPEPTFIPTATPSETETPTPSPTTTITPSATPTEEPSPTPTPLPSVTPTQAPNAPPQITIVSPSSDYLFTAGSTVVFSAVASDAEDGTVLEDHITWQVVFHHDEHTHPFLNNLKGANGSFVVPTAGESAHNIWYQLIVTAEDIHGEKTTTSVDIYPKKSDITLKTEPAGIPISLDDQVIPNPYTFTGVVGFVRSIFVEQEVELDGVSYVFDRWSDNGERVHEFSTPESNTTLTAFFRPKNATELQIAESTLGEGGQYVDARSIPPIGKTILLEAGRTVDNRIYMRSSLDGVNWDEPTILGNGVGGVKIHRFTNSAGNAISVATWRTEDGKIVTRGIDRRQFSRESSTDSNSQIIFGDEPLVSFPMVQDPNTSEPTQSDEAPTTPPRPYRELFSSDPVLTSYNGVLYQSAIDREGQVRWRKTSNLVQWTSWEKANFSATGQVSMSVYKNRVYMGAKDKDGKVFVRYTINSGVTWTKWVDLQLVTSDERIELSSSGNYFFMSAITSEDQVIAVRSFNGVVLSPWSHARFKTTSPLQTVSYSNVSYQLVLDQDGALHYRRNNSLGQFGEWVKTADKALFNKFSVLVVNKQLFISGKNKEGGQHYRVVNLGAEKI